MKIIQKIVMVAAITTFWGSASSAQIIVRIRPARPAAVVVASRPLPPSPHHVWVNEEWVVKGGRYVWHGGYWAAPSRPGAVYVPGHWKNTRRGSIWISGHWR
ncbi:hypothetical protein ACVWYG_001907 [Pedobacter sp. UYEF25]